MIDWFRQRARQERAMVIQAPGHEARHAHRELYISLLRQCHAQPDRSDSLCATCDLRAPCWTLLALPLRGEAA